MQTLSKCVDDLWQTLLLGKPLPYQVWRKGRSGAGGENLPVGVRPVLSWVMFLRQPLGGSSVFFPLVCQRLCPRGVLVLLGAPEGAHLPSFASTSPRQPEHTPWLLLGEGRSLSFLRSHVFGSFFALAPLAPVILCF